MVTNYTLLTISSINKNLEVYYNGVNPGLTISGYIYVYNSSGLQHFIGMYSYPTDNIKIINNNSSLITVFYVGTSTNTIMIVSRIPEFHAANCNDNNNLLFLNDYYTYKQISALNGTCIFTLLIPFSNFKGYGYQMNIFQPTYNGNYSVYVVGGYNTTYTLFEFDNDSIDLLGAQIFGIMISFLIPKKSTLTGYYQAILFQLAITAFFGGESFNDLLLSPNFPFLTSTQYNIYLEEVYQVENAEIMLTIFADIPKNCFLTIYDENGTYLNITEAKLNDTELSFNSTDFFVDYVSYSDSAQWHGFFVKVVGTRIDPPNVTNINVSHKGGGLKERLIIGFSCTALVIILILIGIFTRHQLKKRYAKFDQLCNLLKEMNMSPEEISEMKKKSDELLILPTKVHINFDHILGQGSSSTVYQGYLVGPAPLHLIHRSIATQRFVDCDVAVKVANNFGRTEVELLFKEIEAMKKIGYHENVVCMLGWAMPKDTPCLAFDVGENNVLSFVTELREKPENELPYRKFLSILWQVTRGMQYIASKGIIHCNLTAKNVLLFGSIVAKISDFSLCCFCDETSFYKQTVTKSFPFKCMALESLKGNVFSEKSDVWSFAVLIYEMFTLGKIPYVCMNDSELIEFLANGNRLERPSNVSDAVYEIMEECWNEDPEKRPCFAELGEKFNVFIEIRSELYGYVEAK